MIILFRYHLFVLFFLVAGITPLYSGTRWEGSLGTYDSVCPPDTIANDKEGRSVPSVRDTMESPSPLTEVKLRSPVITIDLLLDLNDRNIDFDLTYSGKFGPVFKPDPEKDVMMEQEVTGIATRTLNAKSRERRDTSAAAGAQTVNQYTADDAKYNKAMVHMNTAQKYFSVKRYTEALQEIDQSIAIAPNISLFHSVRGSILFLLHKTAEAKLSWEKALELDPTLDNIRALLMRMY